MSKDKVIELKKPGFIDSLTELLREGARKLVVQAVEAEFESFLGGVKECLEDGRNRIVRNGYLPKRDILTGLGQVTVQIPRVRDRSEGKEKIQFRSSLIPPYMRRTATLDKVLPLLYLKGISEADFVEVLSPIFGEQAKNLSPGVISRLKTAWEAEYAHWCRRGIPENHFVYWWVDGIGFHVRDGERRCVLVIMGVDENGNKVLLSLEDGFRESTESWLSVLRNLKARGINCPSLVIGDGALGFWNAVSQIFPKARHQRCWFHKMGNVLDKLPKSQQAKAKSMLQEIWMSATREDAYKAFDGFMREYDAKYPKATECLRKDKEALLTFYDFPAEHWVHLRTTNPIESVFATVRNRTYKAKGAFSSKTVLTMAFKLMQSAQKNWIRLRGFNHIDNVIKGLKFTDGILQEEDKNNTPNSLTEKSQNRIAA
jgi:putative transposase